MDIKKVATEVAALLPYFLIDHWEKLSLSLAGAKVIVTVEPAVALDLSAVQLVGSASIIYSCESSCWSPSLPEPGAFRIKTART